MENFARLGIVATVFMGINGAASEDGVLCQPGGCLDVLDLIETYGSDVVNKLSLVIETLKDIRAQLPKILRREDTSNTLDVLRQLSDSSQSLHSISSELSSISDKGLSEGIKIVSVGQAFNSYLSTHLNSNHEGSTKNAILLQAQDFLDFVSGVYKDTGDKEISDTKKDLPLENQVRALKEAGISIEDMGAIVDQIIMLPFQPSRKA